MGETEDYDEDVAVAAHHLTHENGGEDEISVQGLSGLLADAQTPLAHKTSHQDGGSDEISVTGLSGLLADDQHVLDAEVTALIGSTQPTAHKTSHQDAGADEISVAGLSGLLADGQTPLAHKTSHQYGGSDEISVAALSGLLADGQTPLAHKTSHQDGGSDEISVTGLSGILGDPQNTILLPNTLGTNQTAQGIMITKTAGENLAFGDPVYFKSDGKAWKADANTAGAYPSVGIATQVINADASGSILLRGIIRDDAWTWTIGGVIYLSTGAGLTQSQPTATDEAIQVLGVAHPNADTIVWNPSPDYITHT